MKLSDIVNDPNWEPREDGTFRRKAPRRTKTYLLWTCTQCGESCLREKGQKRGSLPFCSTSCTAQYYSGKKRLKTDRIINPDGRVFVRDSRGSRGWVREHWKVFLDANGLKRVPTGLHIHHINMDQQDNRLENLGLMKNGLHCRTHHMMNRVLHKIMESSDIYGEIACEIYDHLCSIGENQ